MAVTDEMGLFLQLNFSLHFGVHNDQFLCFLSCIDFRGLAKKKKILSHPLWGTWPDARNSCPLFSRRREEYVIKMISLSLSLSLFSLSLSLSLLSLFKQSPKACEFSILYSRKFSSGI